MAIRVNTALGGYEYRITRGGPDGSVYNIGERSPGAKAFKVIARVDAGFIYDGLIADGGRAEFKACLAELDAARESDDPADYLRAARRINALQNAPKNWAPRER